MRPLRLAIALVLAGCGGAVGEDEHAIVVDTSDEHAAEVLAANLAYARAYEPRCAASGDRPRVLVSGFGPYGEYVENASGHIVAKLAGLDYPRGDDALEPAARSAVALSTIDLDGTAVDVCALILPVSWDLGAALILKETAAFEPDLVVMNGISTWARSLLLELGAVNRAAPSDDSGELTPLDADAPLVPAAAPEELLRGNLASWQSLRSTVLDVRTALGNVKSGAVRFDTVVEGSLFSGYPRQGNTFICNNTTYVVGWAMDHPGYAVPLLEASDPPEGENGIALAIDQDLSEVPRLFIHWPKAIAGDHVPPATELLRALLATQLSTEEPATRGDNALAQVGPS